MHEVDRAITQRREIEFVYKGLSRVVQPAAHGFHISTGNEVLRGYQIAGRSSSRTVPLWDLFSIGKIEGLQVTERIFVEDPPEYKKGDAHMGRMISQL